MINEQELNVLKAMSNAFFGIYVIDLEKDCYTEIKSKDVYRQILKEAASAQAGLNILSKRMAATDYQDDINKFLDLSTLPQRLNGKEIVSIEYYGDISGWSRANFYPYERDEFGNLKTVIFSAERQNDLKAQELLEQALLENQKAYEMLEKKSQESRIYLDALKYNATFLYYFDLTEGLITSEISMPGNISAIGALGLSLPVSYDEFRKLYYEKMQIETLANDKVSRSDLLEAFARGETAVSTEYYSVRYQRHHRNTVYMTERENDGHIIAVVIGEDVTKQREADQAIKEELQKAYDNAKRASEAKTDFLSHMSHDIRTPINGIVGMTHIMKAEILDKARIEDSIDKIEMLSKQLELLINDILEMSRIERGDIKLAEEPFNLRELLCSLEPALRIMADERDVIMAGASFDVQHETVIGSPLHMQRIAMNIMTNAIKYNRAGGSVRNESREIPIDETHSLYEFAVIDTGIGMSEEFLAHIFEPFTREHEELTQYTGTGLGMAITKELIDMMHGAIRIESKPGEGTSVYLSIPFEISNILPDNKDEAVQISLNGRKVLLVEDNRMNMEVARFVLEEEGAIVETAANGQEAVEHFRMSDIHDIDFVLMDIKMPVMDGLEAARVIRALEREDAKTIPILALSANAFVEDINKCKEAGMSDHIAKPIDIDDMMRKIAKYLK